MNYDLRSTRFWRAVLTIFVLVVVAAVLLASCSDARSSSTVGSTAVSGASQGQGAISPDLIARAMTYLRERRPMNGWTRAVIVAERADVSKGQWAVVAVLPNRHLVPIENESQEPDLYDPHHPDSPKAVLLRALKAYAAAVLG